ncbi:MAG: hypothetical protein US42_C0010G0016 [Candidatus Magasanikbacteria bacterium GW2011_GWC2_37_14]|uniref:Histidine kinase domain-containing protein n=1 Tax=Candidatus Magasanikbacteria bacterium GW2011_GWC2_37_14 TaxID=1619046 RepID=A0A0G0IT78_9BACT|nr:MAG: hypothetical protein US42_C0010G0016 [Candidatus Magasanikbacteria bacterium GW2011_GWC2_37_14]
MDFLKNIRFSDDDTLAVTQPGQDGDERMAGLLKCFKDDGSFIRPTEEPKGGKYTREELIQALAIRRETDREKADKVDYTKLDGEEVGFGGDWKKKLDKIKTISTPEDGFEVLEAYGMLVTELNLFVAEKRWKDVATLALLFNQENMSARLPAQVIAFSDHDTRHLRMEINSNLGKLYSLCTGTSNEEEKIEETASLMQNLREDWELYEFVMGDILMRIEDKERVPERFSHQDFRLSEVLEPVTAHITKIAHHYFYVDNGRRINKTIIIDVDPNLEKEKVLGNQDSLGNILSNTAVNALGFATKSVLIKLEQRDEKIVVGIYNDGEAITEEKNSPESEVRPGLLKIYNEGYSTRKSTGLGLSNADTRLESLGGNIEIVNSKNLDGQMYNGFEISLPLKEK